MARRSYDQFCPIARSLDVLGDRWTLLIIRNLFLGPQRYSDLLGGLPGIPRNLLAARLKGLEKERVVRRKKLPPPAQSVTVYELTEIRQQLEPVLVGLARLGSEFLDQAGAGQAFRPAWGMLALRASFRPGAARGVQETYEFRIDGETFHVRVDAGTADVGQGPAMNPDLVITCDAGTFMAVGSGSLSATEAARSGRGSIEGSQAALAHCSEVFGLLQERGAAT